MTTATQGQGPQPIRTTLPPTGVSTPVAPPIAKTHKQEVEASTNDVAVQEFKKMRPLPTPPGSVPRMTTDIPRKGVETAQVGIPALLHHPVLGQVSSQQKPTGTPQQNKELENAKNQLKTEINHANSLKSQKEGLEKKPALTVQDRKEIAKLQNALHLSAVNIAKASIKMIRTEASIKGGITPQDESNLSRFSQKERDAHKAYTESSLKLIRNDIAAINKNVENNPAYAGEARLVTLKYEQLETQYRTKTLTQQRLLSPEENALLNAKIRSLKGDINALTGALKTDPAAPKPAVPTSQAESTKSITKPLPTPPQTATVPNPNPIPQINLKNVLNGNAKETATKIETTIKPPKENPMEELPSTRSTLESPLTKEKVLVVGAMKTMEAVNQANGKRDGKIVVTEESFKAGNRSLFSAFNAKVESMVRISDTRALREANKSLDDGIAAQKEILKTSKPDVQEIEKKKLETLQQAKETLNNLKWAKGVASSQTYQIRKELDNATAAIRQTQTELNVHDLPPRLTIDEAGSAPPIGKFENLNATNNQAKSLITGSDPTAPITQAKLKALDDQNKILLKTAVDEATKPVRYPIDPPTGNGGNTQAAIDRDLTVKKTTDRVGAEASSVSRSVANDPELKAHADALKNAYDNKKTQLDRGNLSPEGKNALLKDLHNISESLAMVENQHIHRQEAEALSKPEQVSARATAQEVNELKQLKGILEAVKKDPNTTKVILEGGALRTERRGTRSSGAEETADYILGKIPTDLTHPDVNKAAKDIINLVKGDPRLSPAISRDPTRAAQLKTIEDNIKNAVITEAQINVNNKLLTPPADATFQHEFLSTYRSVIKEFTGDKGNATESAKLFNYINDALKDPQTPLYAKQQLLKLTDEWINDSYINSGEVTTHINNLKEIAKTAANDGSPSLKELSEKITTSLPKDKPVAAPTVQADAANGIEPNERRKSQEIPDTSKLLNQIVDGSISVGSKQYKEAVYGLATSMKSQSAANFKAVSSSEFRNGTWTDNYKNKQAPNISAMMQEPNDINYFIVESLMNIADKKNLSPKEMQEQVAIMIEFFVDLQQAIKSPETGPVNYNLMMGIQTALSGSSELGRMPEVFAKLSSDKKKILDDNKELLSITSSYKNLRQAEEELKNNNTPFIPYVGMHLGDMTFMHEGNPSVVKGVDSNQDQLNGFKVKLLGGKITGLNEIQKNIPPPAASSHNLSDINSKSLKYSSDFITEKTTLNATRDKLQQDKEKNKDEIQRIDARLQEIEPTIQKVKENLGDLYSKSFIIKPRPSS